MTNAQTKEAVIEFLQEFEDPDPIRLETMTADHFEYGVMGNVPGFSVPEPIKGKEGMRGFAKRAKTAFPTASTRRSARSSPRATIARFRRNRMPSQPPARNTRNRYHFYFRSMATRSLRYANIATPITSASFAA